MFEYSVVVSIDGISNWDVSKVTNMSKMFSGDNGTSTTLAVFEEKFLDLNISNWNTVNVTDMSSMFEDSTFNNLNISNWNTSNVTKMNSMFSYFELNSNQVINLSNWNVGKVNDWAKFNAGSESFVVAPSKFQ
jgi:surface protein